MGAAVSEILGDDRVLRVEPGEWDESWDVLDDFDFVHGHLEMHHLASMKDRGWTTMLTLRDPVERLMSMYRYDRLTPFGGAEYRAIMQYPSMALPRLMAPGEFFARENVNFTYWDNHYVRAFGGGWDPNRVMRPRDLDQAKRNLDAVDVLLVTEDLDATWGQVAESLWGRPSKMPLLNDSVTLFGEGAVPWTDDERLELRSSIAETQGLDYLLLDWAKDRLAATSAFLKTTRVVANWSPRNESTVEVE